MKIESFRDLEIWKLSLVITKLIYDVTAKERFSKDFPFRDQIRRAILSVSSNIVEGFEKNNNNEFIRFLRIAKGSAGEALNQIEIALIVGYISKEEHENIAGKLESVLKQIGKFISYLDKTRKLRNMNKK